MEFMRHSLFADKTRTRFRRLAAFPGNATRLTLIVLLAPVLLTPVSFAANAPGQAEVVVKPAHVAHRTFNRAHPPPEMPPIKANEAALCYYQFGCEVDCQMESTRTLFKYKPARITKVKITLSLDITVWLPEKDTEKMRAHEEGHREISETIYREAPAIAQKWGDKTIGLTLQNTLKDEAAAQTELKQIQHHLMTAYMQETAKSCERVQTYYDSVTAHGTNNLPEKTAIERALAQEAGVFHVRTGTE